MNIKNIFKIKKLNLILVFLILILSAVLSYEFFYTKEYYFSCIGYTQTDEFFAVENNPKKSYATKYGKERPLKENIRIKVHGFGFTKTINQWDKNYCSVLWETEIYCHRPSYRKPKNINYDFSDSESFDFLKLLYSKSEIYSVSINEGREEYSYDMKCEKLNKPFD